MKELKARIHSFESFGTVDGPGIRFVIFMQGCSLKCKYCHNRDTWDLCGGEEYTTGEVLTKIEKYKNYFMPSGGGITVSGGEPLLQLKFVTELFTHLKAQGVHTAIDTSGNFAITEDIKKVIDLTDLFLLDIKCINDEICKDLTGISNKQELAFAQYLSSIGKDMWIRQVLVPGITDKKEDLEMLEHFVSSLSTVKKIEVLPYHSMGRFKWKELGIDYPLDNTPEATSEDVERAKKILKIL
ncbi:MAG: pyruvate formate lyase-activating protein [Clostridia bacterium]|jgi:pyruvate formate lyase activating enzyme|nr:pyruvate formate lyase-activating protein [Clostridia bacterium]